MTSPKSPHILNTSSNLLGFCFIIITSLKISNKTHQSYIDEILIIAALIFMASSIFSFLSIRSNNEKRTEYLETISEFFFIGGLLVLLTVIILIAFDLL